MDPFRPVLEDDRVLHLAPLAEPSVALSLSAPDLRQWRKEGHEVEVRMLRRRGCEEAECGHTRQTWPRFLHLEVNGHGVLTVKPPHRLRKRRDLPQSISANLRRGENEIEVSAEDERRGDFVLAVVRTRPRMPKEVAQQVRRSSHEDSLARVRRLLADRQLSGAVDAAGAEGAGADAVECVGDERLRLLCPITLSQPASVPVRGEACTHLQCMDLMAYLIANYRTKAFNSRWRCPVCSLRVRPQDLRIDGFVEAVLAGAGAHIEEVLVAPDGSWRPGIAASSSAEASSAAAAAATDIVDDGEDASGVPAPQTPPELRKRPWPVGPQLPPRRADRRGRHPSHPRRKRLPGQPHAAGPGRGRPRLSSKVKRDGRSAGQRRIGRGLVACAGRRVAALARAAGAGVARPAPARRQKVPPPPPRHAIAVDSDAEPEEVSDSGPEEGRLAPEAGGVESLPADASAAGAAAAADGAGDDGTVAPEFF